MTDEQPQSERPVIDMSRHEQEYDLHQEDISDISGLIAVVGKELTTIDKFAAGSSTRKATQLSQQKIFNQKPILQKTQKNSPQQQPSLDNKLQELKQQVVTGNKTQPVTAPQPTSTPQLAPAPQQVSTVSSEKLENKLSDIENKIDKLQDVFNSLLTKISKNTKRITLTLNDSKD